MSFTDALLWFPLNATIPLAPKQKKSSSRSYCVTLSYLNNAPKMIEKLLLNIAHLEIISKFNKMDTFLHIRY